MINDKIKNIVIDEVKNQLKLSDEEVKISYTTQFAKLNLCVLDIAEILNRLEERFKIVFEGCDRRKIDAKSWIMEIGQIIEKMTRKEIGEWERKRYIFITK